MCVRVCICVCVCVTCLCVHVERECSVLLVKSPYTDTNVTMDTYI